MRILQWKDYPKPRLRMNQGKWVVDVSYPASIRHMFGNGKGRSKKLTTGTTDKAQADKREMEIAHKIYRLFDAKQLEYAKRNEVQADNVATDIIYRTAKAFNYNGGNIPDLSPDTDYDVLLAMKTALDGYNEMIENMRPELNEGHIDGIRKAIKKSTSLLDASLQDGPNDPKELFDSIDSLKASFAPINGSFSMEQNVLASKHQIKIVQSYWQDLLTLTATKQGKKPLVFNGLEGIDVNVIETDYGDIPIQRNAPFPHDSDVKPISRPRRNIAKSASNILSFQDEYYVYLDRMYDKIDTRNKLKKGLRRFIDEMGDMPIQEVEEEVVYAFMDKQIDDYEDISKKVLKDNNWGCSTFYEFLKRKSYYKGYNPFKGINYKRLGREADKHLAFKADELHAIFRHNWKPQERLFLQILVTTGMRLSEVGNMTWERYHENYDGMQGLRVFSLADTDAEKVTVKNSGSKRDMPLHDDLVMPPKGTGRIFDYKQNKDGLCSHDAGRIINPILQQIVSGRHKSLHSFRRTFKVMLRSVGVSEEINNNYTGHKHGGSDQESYGGVYEDFVRQEINKMKHPWLKYESKLD